MPKNPSSESNQITPKKTILIFIFLAVILTIVAAAFQFIYNRHAFGLNGNTHDGAIEVEEAVKFLLQGKNPYTENYFDTPMKDTPGLAEMDFANPALYHLIYLPFNIIFSIPFFLASNFLLHYFDERIVYMFTFLIFAGIILKWPNRSLERKLAFLIIFIANPLFFVFFIQGRNDIFVFTWIALAVYFLEQKNNNLSSLTLALAIASKHSGWFILPFYFAYLYYQEAGNSAFRQKINNILKKTYVFFAATAVLIIPFLVWDYSSFIDDIVKYPNGTTFMSYPVTGFGFSQLTLKLNLISSPNEYWPFWIPQAILGLPILYILLKMQKNNNTASQMIFNLSVILLTFWLFSRFFNNNYIGFLTMLFLFSIFLIKKPEKTSLPAQNPLSLAKPAK